MHCFQYLISPSFLSQSLNFHCTRHSSGEPINRLVCRSHHNMHARIIRFQQNVCTWQCVFVFECVIREMEREPLWLLSQRFIGGYFFLLFFANLKTYSCRRYRTGTLNQPGTYASMIYFLLYYLVHVFWFSQICLKQPFSHSEGSTILLINMPSLFIFQMW